MYNYNLLKYIEFFQETENRINAWPRERNLRLLVIIGSNEQNLMVGLWRKATKGQVYKIKQKINSYKYVLLSKIKAKKVVYLLRMRENVILFERHAF